MFTIENIVCVLKVTPFSCLTSKIFPWQFCVAGNSSSIVYWCLCSVARTAAMGCKQTFVSGNENLNGFILVYSVVLAWRWLVVLRHLESKYWIRFSAIMNLLVVNVNSERSLLYIVHSSLWSISSIELVTHTPTFTWPNKTMFYVRDNHQICTAMANALVMSCGIMYTSLQFLLFPLVVEYCDRFLYATFNLIVASAVLKLCLISREVLVYS